MSLSQVIVTKASNDHKPPANDHKLPTNNHKRPNETLSVFSLFNFLCKLETKRSLTDKHLHLTSLCNLMYIYLTQIMARQN